MKKLTFLALAAVASSAFAGFKIGTVDMMILVRNHPSYESNRDYLRSTEKDYQKGLDAMQAVLDDLQDEGQRLANELKNPMLAEAAKEKTESQIMDVQRRYVKQQQDLRKKAMENQQQLSQAEARLLKSQADDLRKRITRFAQANDYDLVLDAAAAIYHADALDVTDAILKEMGVDPEEARAKEKNEGK